MAVTHDTLPAGLIRRSTLQTLVHKFSGGALGSLLYRDTGQSDGANWLADVAVGQVLISGGIGAAPAWSATPVVSAVALGAATTSGVRLEVNASGDLDVREGDDSGSAALASGTLVRAGTGTGTYTPSGPIHVNTTSVGTDANTNEKTLWTYSLPANALSANGKGVRVTAWGTVAANGNNKSVRLYFGATNCLWVMPTYAANNMAWAGEILVVRTGAANQVAIGRAVHGVNDGSVGNDRVLATAPAADTTGAIVIKVTGQNGTASANDIVFTGVIVEVL